MKDDFDCIVIHDFSTVNIYTDPHLFSYMVKYQKRKIYNFHPIYFIIFSIDKNTRPLKRQFLRIYIIDILLDIFLCLQFIQLLYHSLSPSTDLVVLH